MIQKMQKTVYQDKVRVFNAGGLFTAIRKGDEGEKIDWTNSYISLYDVRQVQIWIDEHGKNHDLENYSVEDYLSETDCVIVEVAKEFPLPTIVKTIQENPSIFDYTVDQQAILLAHLIGASKMEIGNYNPQKKR